MFSEIKTTILDKHLPEYVKDLQSTHTKQVCQQQTLSFLKLMVGSMWPGFQFLLLPSAYTDNSKKDTFSQTAALVTSLYDKLATLNPSNDATPPFLYKTLEKQKEIFDRINAFVFKLAVVE